MKHTECWGGSGMRDTRKAGDRGARMKKKWTSSEKEEIVRG